MAGKSSFTFGDPATSDVKLIVKTEFTTSDGKLTIKNNDKVLFLHSSIIEQYPPFKELLSKFSFPPPNGCKHHITTTFKGNGYGLNDYIDFIKLMYCSDEELSNHYFNSHDKVLSALRFASDYSFTKLADRCMFVLSCVRWSEDEEEEIRRCIAHLEIKPSQELTDRLSNTVTAEMVEGFFFHRLMIKSPLPPIPTRKLIEECLGKGGELRQGMNKCIKECVVLEISKLESGSSDSTELLSWLVQKVLELWWFDVLFEVIFPKLSNNPSIVARVAPKEENWPLFEAILMGLSFGKLNYSAALRVALLKTTMMLMADGKGDPGRWNEKKELWFGVADGLPLIDQHDLFKWFDHEGLVWEDIKVWWQKRLSRALGRLPNAPADELGSGKCTIL